MSDHTSLAERLFEAWRDASPLPPETLPHPLDLPDAYALQAYLRARFAAAGREAIGWKIGLTSNAAMQAFGATEPMVGVIYRDTVIGDRSEIDYARLIAPRIEGEMLLEIGAIPGHDADDDALIASIACVRPAFEIADSRVTAWPKQIGGLIADNAACGLIVYDDRAGVAAADTDFAGAAMTMRCDGELVTRGSGADCLGGILAVYRWFIADSVRTDRQLRPGQVILCGAMGSAVPMRSDSDYEMVLTGVGSLRTVARSAAGSG